MNHSTNKRWGHRLLLIFCTFLLILGGIFAIPFINNNIGAESSILDDGASGEKIVDISEGAGGFASYALTENGEIYSWGVNRYGELGNGNPIGATKDYKPRKVLNAIDNTDGNKYLSNIRKVMGGGSVTHSDTTYNGGYAFAITNDNTLYAWGNNTKLILGLPEAINYEIPTKVPLNFKVKDIHAGRSFVVLLSEEGEAYVSGYVDNNWGQLGLGKDIKDTQGFKKISKVINSAGEESPTPKIKKIYAQGANGYILIDENNCIYTAGNNYYTGGDPIASKTFYPILGVNASGNALIVEDVVSAVDYAFTVRTSQGIYISRDFKNSKKVFVPISEYAYLIDSYGAYQNIIQHNSEQGGSFFLTIDNQIYKLNGYTNASFIENNITVEKPNLGNVLPIDYANTKKIIGGGNGNVSGLLLSNNGGVYFGVNFGGMIPFEKISFGDLSITAKKTNGNSYASAEKYNEKIDIEIKINSSEITMDQIRVTERDLLSNTNSDKKTTSGNFTIDVPVEGERIYKEYVFTVENASDVKATFIVDLYKGTPHISDINDNGIYKIGKTIDLKSNGFSENINTATIKKDSGNVEIYPSGTAIAVPGSYVLEVADLYGNTNTYNITVTDQAIAESIIFNKSGIGELNYGNAITKAGAEIGTLSLRYADGDPVSQIQSMSLGTGQDGSKFELSNTNHLKVKDANLNAGIYQVPVSGMDTNNMPFSGIVTITIAKGEQPLTWNATSQGYSTKGIEVGKEFTLGTTSSETPTIIYGMKEEHSCITLDPQTGVGKATCIPETPVVFTAIASETDNYLEKTIELNVSIKKQAIALQIELQDYNAIYKDNVTINLGDRLPTGRITSNIDGFDVSSLGTPTYIFTKDGTVVDDPTAQPGTYIVTATYPTGSAAEGYDITSNTATLIVNDIEINDSNASDFYTLTSNNTPYIPGTWTKYPVVITPTNDKFKKIEINSSGTKESSAFTYENEGVHNVTLTFHHDNGASISTTVQMKQDFTSPVVSQFQYTEESTLRSFLRTITFDRFFSKSQEVAFTGTDTEGSGIDHYRYEIVEIKDHSEDSTTLQSDTLSPSDSLKLSVNHSYRISAWAIDVAGNESTEKIERVFLSDKAATLEINATSDGSVYDGTNWTSKQVTIQLNSTSDAGVNKYQYSVNGTDFNDMSSDTITLPDPLTSINNQNYTFRAMNNDGTTCDQTLQMKVDPIKPEIKVQASVNGSDYDGSEVEHDINLIPSSTNNNISGITYYYTTKESAKDQDPRTDSNWKKYEGSLLHQTNGTYTYYFKGISGAGVLSENQSVTVKRKKKEPITLQLKLKDVDDTYKQNVTIHVGDSLPQIQVSCDDKNIDVSALGTPIYTYKKDGTVIENPSILAGSYTVNAEYDTGESADFYDITWVNATLTVEDIVIDNGSMKDYFTLISDGKPYTQGTWTNKDIIITPVHATFNQIDIDDAGNKSTNDYTYSVAGDQTIKLSFYNSDGAKVSTTVNLKVDQTAPTLSNFNYENETRIRSFLRAVSFDHFFGEAQQLSFSGSDEAGGSGLDHYRYEIVELDADKNEKPASKKTGTLGLNEKLNLSINTSYRISAWAVDTAGNESDEKIERVFLSDEVAQLNITATSDGKPYDGSKWTKSGVTVKLSSTSNAGVEKYQYSSDGVVFHDITGDTITLPDPLANIDNVTYTFRAINNDHTESDKTLNLKVDTVKPEINITGKVNDSPYDGSLVDQNIELTVNQTNTNISGVTYYYTTSPTSKDTDPKTDSNWKRYTAPITHSANGTFTYYFKAISNAGISSDRKDITVKLAKKEYTNITVNVTSEGKTYSPGNWTKGDVTFTLSGGLKDESQITGYEYTTTNGSTPSSSATWKPVTNKKLILIESIKDQTYWFRVTPVDSDGKISTGTKVNLDVDVPTLPTMTLDEVNNTKVAQLINLFSFGNWMNKQAKVTMTSSDITSGIDHYEYVETINGTDSKPKSSEGSITYEDEIELTLKARACDKAGNCSAYTNAEAIKIDMKAPGIAGVKDQSEYKQYYLPRFVTITDSVSGLKQATYKKDNAPSGTFTDNEETEIKGEGSYEIYAVDEAGNEVTITFKIVKLPNIETEINGSDESRESIDQIIKELEEVKEKIDQNEKDNYEQWIKDAEDKWDSLRKKVIEDDETTSKVEGQGNTTFDPNTELIVEEIPKENVPVLPRNAIKTYDVYLKKGNTVVQPDGSVKVYLPYDEKETPIVYEINDDGTIKELPSKKENGFVTFITDTLKKYAISNTAQKENKKDVCVVGPDNQLNTKDDVCGSDNSTKNDDGSVTVPDGGKVIFPDKEIDAPNGATINPDGSVDYPDGTHYDPDGNKTKDPDKKPDPKPNPDDNDNPSNDDKVCSVGADGKQNTNDDICGKPNGDGDKPIINPDGSITIPDGGSVIFPDGNEVELPDGGIIKPDGSVELPDGTTINPDGTKKDDINIDTDNDGKPDINIDIDGDGKPDINIDTNNDGVPDINIDTTGDGKPDYNIDTNGDQKPDVNVGPLPKPWKPNTCHTVNKINYCTMHGLKPNINIDTNNDGIPDLNVDVDGDGSADLNIDTDFDNIPNIDIDSTGDGKPDLNIDRTGNGKADENIQEVTVWNPTDIVTVNGTTYGIMKALYQEPQPTPEPENPNPTPPTDGGQTKEPEPTPQPSVKGSYQANVGGAGTSDTTNWYIWEMLIILTISTSGFTLYKKCKQK